MPVALGARLGAYDIVASLGAGGMGEVYRARDTKLGREVAIKVLPEALAFDPERTARFQREAQLLAALNHPHIATIHGFEEAPSTHSTSSGQAGAGQAVVQFLVMELVEGDTLVRRLEAGPIPVTQALAIARQVADALQAAHEKGIIHRDLKPANIAVTSDGSVKVLDFGLAKALGPPEGGPYVPGVGAGFSRPDLTASPTLSLGATQAGVILGTAAYMSPEQARGKLADKRADIWAFGCVLYEMLTGRRAFEGEDAAQTLAFVMAREADWAALPSDVPAPIVTMLRSCLEKERRNRIADIAAATFVLDHAAQLEPTSKADVPASDIASAVSRPVWRRAAPVAAALVIGALGAAGTMWLLTRSAPPSVVRTTLTTSGPVALAVQGADRDIAITPDGSRVVYRGNNQLLVRALDQLEPTALSGLGTPRGVRT